MPTQPAVAVEGLHVQMGGRPILKGVTLMVQRGELYGLLGRNGAGKTTTMRCLLGYLPFGQGKAALFGVPSQALQRLEQPYGVGLDPPGMDDSLTLRQNLEVACLRAGLPNRSVTLPSGRQQRGVDEVLALVGLTHRQHNRGDRLSHGQGRRAAVARALLGAPELLILDEPLSGLDPEGVERLLELFQQLTREEGVTIILSSHHLREVEHVCDRVGILEDGRTLLEGEVTTLLAAAGDRVRVQGAEAQKLIQAIADFPGVMASTQVDATTIELRVDASFDGAAALSHLVRADTGVFAFEPARANLVDVFRHAVAEGAA